VERGNARAFIWALIASVIFGFALVAFAVSTLSAAAETRAELVSVTLAPPTATVGDRLTLTIVVDHDDGSTVEGPGFGADFGGLEAVEIAPPRTERRDERLRTTLDYTLTAFATGFFTVPALRVEAGGPEGAVTLETPPQTVNIESVLQPGETELRPLKPQLEIDEEAPSPLSPALIVALFAALTAFGYALVRRAIAERPRSAAAVASATPLTAHDRAHASLDALAQDDVQAYYAGLAATVRRYLSERFAFGAFAMTRTEMERGMAGAGIDRWPARLTANLLEQCDAVVFAGFRPPRERIEADLTAAYEIVELTADDAQPSGLIAP
jgi:hypothetical protein